MFKSILVAVDGSDHARKALRIAADIADLYGAELAIMHVVTGKKIAADVKRMAEVEHLVEPPKAASYNADIPAEMSRMLSDANLHTAIAQIATALGQRLLDESAGHIRETNQVKPQIFLEHGDPTREILARTKKQRVDLIVLGSRGLSDIEGTFMGSVSSKVAHAAESTCLTVK